MITKIMVIDGCGFDASDLTKRLSKEGYEIVDPGTEEPVRFCVGCMPDVVLIEHCDDRSLRICEKLKDNEITRNIPLILMSHKIDEEGTIKALKLGCIDFINQAEEAQDLIVSRLSSYVTLAKARTIAERLCEITKET